MACLFLFATTARASEGRSRWRRACRHTVGELAVDIARRPRRGRAELNQPVGQHEGMDVLDVTGSTVIVTGASTGIGAATARLLHEAGAHPVLAARRADRLAELSEELDGALAVPTDVTDPTAVRRLVETTLDRHGRIDGLVNNAGVSLRPPQVVTRSVLRLMPQLPGRSAGGGPRAGMLGWRCVPRPAARGRVPLAGCRA